MKANNSLVSVIIPVYKVEKYLRTCIDSVINQTYITWEMILVDDGSPDNCPAICDEYAQIDDRIKVIHKENGGQAQARNRALDVCKGEYVSFLDSDDFLHRKYLSYMVGLAQREGADIVQCGFTRGELTEFPEIEKSLSEGFYDNHTIFLSGKANIIVWGKLYKREIVVSNRIREGKYYEDDFTTWKWYYHAKKIAVSNKILYYYTVNPTSTMAQHQKKPSFDFLEAYDERISFFMGTKEKDLEDCSRLQLCKALVLLYSNKMISRDERNQIKNRFDESLQELVKSDFIPSLYMVLFRLFGRFPLLTSKLSNCFYN